MANEPKLSVFKIQLHADKNPSFYKRFVQNPADVSETEDSVFLNFMRDFFKEGDNQKFHRNKTKAFTLTPEDTEEGVQAIRHHIQHHVIEGTVIGGRHNDEYTESQLDDKTKKRKVEKDAVLTRKIYFFLHTPMDSDVGVLMVQSYANESVTTLLVNFIKKFFEKESRGYREATIKRYIPPTYIEEFQRNAVVKSFTFETNMLLGHLTDETLGTTNEKFKVTVKVESANGIKKKLFDRWKDTISKSKIGLGTNTQTFADFNKGKASIENQNKKKSSFELKRNFDIQPTIYLDESKIKWKTDREIDFLSLREYCFSILAEINDTVYINE